MSGWNPRDGWDSSSRGNFGSAASPATVFPSSTAASVSLAAAFPSSTTVFLFPTATPFAQGPIYTMPANGYQHPVQPALLKSAYGYQHPVPVFQEQRPLLTLRALP
ncbi:hypothetical protein PG989_000505 [Apiospora arundinis]